MLIVVRAVDLVGYDTFVPHAGRRVVFVGPGGAVTDTVTDADGVAVGPGVPDTTVFVVRYGSYLHIFTAVGPGTIIDVAPPPWTRFTSFSPLAATQFRFSPSPPGTQLAAPDLPFTASTVDTTVPVLPIGPARLHTYLAEPVPPGTIWWTAIDHEQPLASLGGAAIDLSNPLARIRDVTFGPDLALRWSWAGNVAHKGDLFTFHLTYRRPDGLGGNADVYGPGDRDALVIPHWPAALAHLAPATVQHVGPPSIYDPIDRTGYAAALRDAYDDRATACGSDRADRGRGRRGPARTGPFAARSRR